MSKFEQYLIEAEQEIKTSDDFGNNYTMPKNIESKFLVHLGKVMKEKDNDVKFSGLAKSFVKAWSKYRTNKTAYTALD